MRFSEITETIKNDRLGAPTPTALEVAEKHGVSPRQIMAELAMGVEVEREHTGDESLAREIALDHLAELPDYYSKLKDMEGH